MCNFDKKWYKHTNFGIFFTLEHFHRPISFSEHMLRQVKQRGASKSDDKQEYAHMRYRVFFYFEKRNTYVLVYFANSVID